MPAIHYDLRRADAAPIPPADVAAASEHLVQFYDDDAFLIDAVARFAGAGLAEGEAVFVIATEAHREAIEARLRAAGVDGDLARRQRRYVSLDARATLRQIGADGWPDADRFADAVGARIARAASEHGGRARAYGEMVALLRADGRRAAALRLEELWSGFGKTTPLSLMYGYAMAGFDRSGDLRAFQALEATEDRLRLVATLQQKARVLGDEAARRREIEQTLRERNEMLQALVQTSPVPIVVIGCDATVHLWNAAAQRVFGWSEAEVLGRRIPIVPEDRMGEWASLRSTVAQGEGVVGVRTTRLRRDEAPIEVNVSATPLREASGAVREILLVFEDVTLPTKAERARQKTLEELATLTETGRTLVAELDFEHLLATVTDAAAQLSGAAYGVFVSVAGGVHADRDVRVASGMPRDAVPSVERLREAPVVATTLAGEEASVVRDDVRTDASAAGLLTPFGGLPVASYLAVPVVGRAGSVLGGLFLGHPEPGVFTSETERIITGLAAQLAIALHSAHLYEAERIARAAAEGARRRAAFLAEAGAALAASLDYAATLQDMAALVVERVADVCLVEVPEPSGGVRRAGATRLGATDDVPPELLHGTASEPLLAGDDLERSVLVRAGAIASPAAASRADTMQRLGARSWVIAPMAARGRRLGVVGVGAEQPDRYDDADRAMVESLAHRAALAVDNARLYEETQQASRMRDEFLTTISHELRTPLAAIMNWVNTLRQGKLGPERTAHALDVLKRAGETQAKLIEDILDASRAVSGRLRLDLRPVVLQRVIGDALEALRPAADAKGVRVDVEISLAVPPAAGDPARLQQIVWNLLSNAVKFTPRDGRVSLRLERDDVEARIVVADTGVGIDPAFLPHVFERFRQGESADARRQGGLGLGLAIVKYLVEAHGGRVSASSAGRDRGAEFVVGLPLAPLAPQSAGDRRP